jgi:2-polyprenyl-6-hydroxyphenyl methylase/3-demethylubiquinone-9 3-methyltransferase
MPQRLYEERTEVTGLKPKGLPHSGVRMSKYYEDKLSAEGLRKCYEIASPRIRQYLDAEVRFVIDCIKGSERVLELGCGYGRVMKAVAPHVQCVTGCDTSWNSLSLAKDHMRPRCNYDLVCADASCLTFRQGIFDAVFCVQNGISAFGVDRRRLITEALRVTKDGGLVFFSSYSPKIWKHRLAWFREQSKAGLVGEIDEFRTGRGTIICKDGFRATAVSRADFRRLFLRAGTRPCIREVDESSLFCVARK